VAEDMRQSGHIFAAYGVVQGQGFVCDAMTQRTAGSIAVFLDETA